MAVAALNGTRSQRIREINDACRTSFLGCSVNITPSVVALDDKQRAELLEAVRSFDTFEGSNDPHREHDFGAILMFDNRWFWKFDYYDPTMRMGSNDPSDIETTRRVLTIMAADEY